MHDLIVAFDPGTKHLGICAVSTHTEHERPDTIVLWEVIDVSGGVDAFTKAMRGATDDVLARAHTVVIERQPPLNRSALQIQHWIEVYVNLRNPACTIVLRNAQTRVAYVRRVRPDLDFSTYARRKKSSIQYVRTLVKGTPDESRFEREHKKDDLAEAYTLTRLVPRVVDN